MDSYWLIPISDLPDLKPAAQVRIRRAHEQASELLLEGIDVAWREFAKAEERARTGRSTASERINALQSAQQADKRARVAANLFMFDTIAAEYSAIDTEHQAYVDRLHMVVLPAVRASMPTHDPDKAVFEAVQARATYDTTRPWPEAYKPMPGRRKLGRPYKLTEGVKRQALERKRSGGTNSECARILYHTKFPTNQQVKNVPAILKHFVKTCLVPNG